MAVAQKSIWIISPAADLGLLILTPLAIIPLVMGLSATVMTPEAIALGVFAFASLGHHLPGLMRAYGDPELFARYRWRFLLAPPLVIGVCWLSFITFKLHGLELLLLLWATWHILMQTYGFMRIYDMKQGHAGRWHANWDFAACLTVFAAGFVFSDIRMFGFTDTLSLAGVPLFSATALEAARLVVGVATGVILLGYLLTAITAENKLAHINWLKILLLASTALLYWWSGNLSVNLLIGVAMFDIFHAIQYDAIVWYYNRRRAEKAADQAGAMGWLFHARWWALPTYVAAIAAFGLLGIWGRSGEASFAQQVAMTLFAASAMLHFYYDGFIWKVSQPKTSENLNIDPNSSAPATPAAWRHSVGWIAFGGLLITLGLLESRAMSARGEAERMLALQALTPEVPELNVRLSAIAMAGGRSQEAYEHARKAVERRPRSFAAACAMAEAAVALGNWDEAEQLYANATALRPNDPLVSKGLAEVYFRQGENAVQREEFDVARNRLDRCLAISPRHAGAHYQAGNMYFLTSRPEEAAKHYRACVEAKPDFTDAYNNLGAALYQSEKLADAADAYRQSIELQPDFAPAHYNLALVLISQGETSDARRSVLQAAALGQQPSPEVLRAVGF